MSDRQPCTHCQRPARLPLCHRCTDDLRDNLRGLPTWIGYLRDAANGQTRLGESARRSTDKGSPMLPRIGPAGGKGAKTVAQSFRHSPSDLLAYTHSVLTEWAIDLHNTHKVPIPGAVRHVDARNPAAAINHAGATETIALWLAQHAHQIAHDPAANICHREITQIINDISNTINRPRPPRNLGPCPTITDDHTGANSHGKRCATRLTATHAATETQCPRCKTTHEVAKLIADLIDEVDDWDFTQTEVLFAMEALGQPIPLRTFRNWRAAGKLPTRYDADGAPVYRLADVRDLADNKPQQKATGASAHTPRA